MYVILDRVSLSPVSQVVEDPIWDPQMDLQEVYLCFFVAF